MASEDRIIESVRAIVRESLKPIEGRLDIINQKLFVGNGAPSLMVQQAQTEAKVDSLAEKFERAQTIKPPPPKGPTAFWKMVGLVLVAIVTTLGTVFGSGALP